MLRPKIKNIDAAIRIAHGDPYISCKEIIEIFGEMGSQRMARIRREVREAEAAAGIPTVVHNHICVEVAFKVWGIDVDELIRKRKVLQKLNML